VILFDASCARATEQAPQNIILITVDTLRADHLGTYGSQLDLTPNLDALAKRSLVFREAYTTAPFTFAALTSLITGRLPEEYGILSNTSTLPNDIPTLATQLKARGFRTAAVVGNFVLREGTGFEQGFDQYIADFPDREPTRGMPESIATSTTYAALKSLEELSQGKKKRFFLWVHYQDPHGPYTPPRGYRERYLDAEHKIVGTRKLRMDGSNRGFGTIPNYQALGEERSVAFYRAGYDGEIRFVDEQIGRLLNKLRELHLMENSIVVFTADHGESLGTWNYWFAHGEYLLDVLINVPLLIYVPNGSSGERADVASLLDLFPTLLDQVGALSKELRPGRGRNLLAPEGRNASSVIYLSTLEEATVRRSGLIADGYKFILDDASGQQTLYSLGTGLRDQPVQDPEKLRLFSERLDAYRKGIQPIKVSTKPVDESARELLRALGYISE